MFELNWSEMGVTGQIFPGGKRQGRADIQVNNFTIPFSRDGPSRNEPTKLRANKFSKEQRDR